MATLCAACTGGRVVAPLEARPSAPGHRTSSRSRGMIGSRTPARSCDPTRGSTCVSDHDGHSNTPHEPGPPLNPFSARDATKRACARGV
eukprot:1137043-Prymnesium_polylepis.2